MVCSVTAGVVPLSSPTIVLSSDRVRDFIELARNQINALIPTEEWSCDLWEVGEHFITKGQNRHKRVLAFYNISAVRLNRQEIAGGLLAPAFKEFAKAYMRYMHSTSPVSFTNTAKRLEALQFIEAGFQSLGLRPAIENLNVVVLNTAVEMAKSGVGPARHYQFALCIQQVYRFSMGRRFLNAPFQWRHGIRKPKDPTEALGKEAKEWREERLPSPEAFHALAYIFRNGETFIDRLYSAVCAICISIPIRAHEVLQLRLDCEVRERIKSPDTGEDMEAYGIRVWPGKGNPPQVKWVPTQMVSVVQEAIKRLNEMCAAARDVAEWYESHPNSLWLPKGMADMRELEWVSKQVFLDLLGLAGTGSLRAYLKQRQHIRWKGEANRPRSISEINFADLERHLISLLPNRFPHFNGQTDQLYSETLMLLMYNQGHSRRGTVKCLIEMATVQGFGSWLSGHDQGRIPSIFTAWNFTEKDGSPIRITTHTFRHWLNTIAHFKGMSDLDIAKWSGRDISQNKAYNHVTPEETLSQIRQALDDGKTAGPMFEPPKASGIRRPVDRREFIDAQIGAAHVTDFGICVHDYSLLPCQNHGDCAGCAENVFVKGDQKHRDRVSTRLASAEKQLAEARRAVGDEFFGADKWVAAHQGSIERMRWMLDVHGDPSVPDGTIIHLPGGSDDNELAMALRDRDSRDGTSYPPLDWEC